MGPLADRKRPKVWEETPGRKQYRRKNACRYCTATIAVRRTISKPTNWASSRKMQHYKNVRKWAARRVASGPSLGRKRPRRATAARSATAPQYRIGSIRNARDADLIFYANLQMCSSRSGTGYICNYVNWSICPYKSNIYGFNQDWHYSYSQHLCVGRRTAAEGPLDIWT